MYFLFLLSIILIYSFIFQELWTVPASQHKQGLVIHTVGWPMDMGTYGGAFVYHLENNQVFII